MSSGTKTPRRARFDADALRDQRLWMMLPVIVFAAASPFYPKLFPRLWEHASAVAQTRLFARLCVDFLLLTCFPAIFILIRLGLTDVTASQHRSLLRVYPTLTTLWQCLVALDGFMLVARPDLVALPNRVFDIFLSVSSAALVPFILHHQSFFFGFDARALHRADLALHDKLSDSHVRTPLDTLDYRVLQLVAGSGGDIASVMINDMGIGHRDLMLRLTKLVALGYLHVVEEMHGPQVVLSTLATDTLALPVSLFTWDTDDRELLFEIASARLALEAREPQNVVVACARACERMLRGLLSTVVPKVTQIGSKDISKATLGDLVGACRQYKLIGRFEDGIFSAMNERRKKIHALEGEQPINDQDAFVLYTLTEIAARDIVGRRRSVNLKALPPNPEGENADPGSKQAAAKEE